MMNKKLLSLLFRTKKTGPLAQNTLRAAIDLLTYGTSSEVTENLLAPSTETRELMGSKKLAAEDFKKLQNVIFNRDAAAQKAALGIMIAHSHNRAVRNFLNKELGVTAIDWSKLNKKTITDKGGNKYYTELVNVAPLTYYLYLIPVKRTPFAIDFRMEDELLDLSIALKDLPAGRFIFSIEDDKSGYLPSGKTLTPAQLKQYATSTALPDSLINKKFQKKNLYNSIANLIHSALPADGYLYLTDINHEESVSTFEQGGAFSETVFGHSFSATKFNCLELKKYIEPPKCDELPPSIYYAAALQKVSP